MEEDWEYPSMTGEWRNKNDKGKEWEGKRRDYDGGRFATETAPLHSQMTASSVFFLNFTV